MLYTEGSVEPPASFLPYTAVLPSQANRIPIHSSEEYSVWSKTMAQVCAICQKGPQFGNNISHAHNVTRRRWNVNLRPVRAKVNGGSKKMRVCTSCIKSGKVVKA
jgi:large subunit ribosomal protein L28